MATYVMSDIHGCYTEFRRMLEKIAFDPAEDELIIAGDIVDRGDKNYEMLEYAASKPEGVTFLMGNHDQDFVYYCEKLEELFGSGEYKDNLREIFRDFEGAYLFSYRVGDRYETVQRLILDEQRPAALEDFRRWKAVMERFPYTAIRKCEGRRYIIVHAGFIQKQRFDWEHVTGRLSKYDSLEQFYVWAREDGVRLGGVSRSTVVFGHTPTVAEGGFYNHGKVYIKQEGLKRFINIDCGCVFSKWDEEANLACIRLEDEKIFYLKD